MRGILVSNTGPLVALALVERLDILRELFGSVLVPEAVHQEILQGGRFGAGVAAYNDSPWIQVHVLETQLDPLLTMVLDVGEASVIQLARQCMADAVLIDERKARKVARTVYKLEVFGTARLLVEAKRRGLLERVDQVLAAMRENGYWIEDRIVAVALVEAGEA